MEVECYLSSVIAGLKEEKYQETLIYKNLAGFVTFYFALCLILVYSNIVKACEMLLTNNLRIRNTDPCFHLASCYKKHFLISNEKWCFLYVGCYCTCMIDVFCKNMTATSHCNDRQSTFKSAKIIVKKYENL